MANNFIELSGSIRLSGSLQITDGSVFTGDLVGTSSWANSAQTSSYFSGASIEIADLRVTNTASIEYLNVVYQSSSVVYSSGSNIFGDAPDDTQTLHGQVDILNNATVSGKLDVVGGITGSLLGSSSYSVNGLSASYAETADNAINAVNATNAVNAANAVNASNATNASFASNAANANYAVSASNAISSSYSIDADSAISASHALEADHALNADVAISASHALLADGLNATSLTLADLIITNTASIQYLNVVFESSSVIYSSGSNVFGDAADDIQTLNGQVNIINDAQVDGKLSVLGGITGSLLGSASYALSSSYAITASHVTLAQSASWAAGVASIAFAQEIHVSSGSGNDSTGDGSLNRPYKTVTAAYNAASAGGGNIIIVHRGIYTENITVTKPNLSFIGSETAGSGLVEINGTFTVNIASAAPSTRIDGMRIKHLVHQGSGSLYGWQINVLDSYTKSGPSAYSDFIDSEFQCVTGSVISGPGTVVFQAGKQYPISVNNAGAAVYIKDSLQAIAPSVTAGTLAIQNSNVYPIASGSAAVTAAAGTFVQIFNSTITTLTGLPERVAISGFFGYDDVQFNKALSTLGTQLGVKAYFQSLDALNLTATGSLFGNASTATSASFATLANGLNPGSSISAVNITGSGNLTISGKINFANLPAYSDDSSAAAGGVAVGDLYRNGNFVVIRVS